MMNPSSTLRDSMASDTVDTSHRMTSIVSEPLVALGEPGSAFANIFAPESEIGQARIGVTAQFLDNAHVYHKRYANTAYWSMLLDVALARIDAPAPDTVIDIGSGSGNSVLPLLKKFPHAYVVASDISPNLLAILGDYFKDDPQTQQRLGLLCADASRVRFAPGCAALVVGAAILHHIIEPESVIERAFTALKPGGWAIFFEPFRSGSSLLTLAYKQVLRCPEAQKWRQFSPASNAGLEVLANVVHDYDTRVAMSAAQAANLDDKWMFERAQFEALATKHGWAQCKCFSMQDGKAPVRTQTISYLRLAAELDQSSLPDWAWDILDEFDAQLSDDVRKSAWMEAMVLLQKPASSLDETAETANDPYNRWYWSPQLDRQGLFLARHDGRYTLYWCGFDHRGSSAAYVAPLDSTLRGRLADHDFGVVLQGAGLSIQRADGSSFAFQIFLSGAAPAAAHGCGAYANADGSQTLLIETRGGIVHAALILGTPGDVYAGALQRDLHGWSGTLQEYAHGSAPFAAVSLVGAPTSRELTLRCVTVDANTLAVASGNHSAELFTRKGA